jgi:hypothetical protein
VRLHHVRDGIEEGVASIYLTPIRFTNRITADHRILSGIEGCLSFSRDIAFDHTTPAGLDQCVTASGPSLGLASVPGSNAGRGRAVKRLAGLPQLGRRALLTGSEGSSRLKDS